MYDHATNDHATNDHACIRVSTHARRFDVILAFFR